MIICVNQNMIIVSCDSIFNKYMYIFYLRYYLYGGGHVYNDTYQTYGNNVYE